MSVDNMAEKVNKVISELKNIIQISIVKGQYHCAMAAIMAGCGILYEWNQYYVDEDFENYTKQIGKDLVHVDISLWDRNREKVVLFYDSFGLDTRGLALIYLKAVVDNGHPLIYVTDACGQDRQIEIDKVLKRGNAIKIYVDGDSLDRLKQINDIFEKYHPTDAFFYTTPNDVPAAAVFDTYEGLVTRYQINLTDHAFWLGKYAFDYCIEFRDYGYYASKQYRGISEHKLLILPYYPVVDRSAKFLGWPFELMGRRVVFSGGSLYKTLGDSEERYYKIVEHILQNHNDIVFVYAGNGDASRLNELIRRHPEQIYHIDERKDLLQVLEHSVLYLNTFPMGGGLMTQYAAVAGKLPLILKQGDDMAGILINQSRVGVEYDNFNVMMDDIDRLLSDCSYLKDREEKLAGSVISEQTFRENIESLLNSRSTCFDYDGSTYDTTDFRKNYVRRFDKTILNQCLANRRTLYLVRYFPLLFVVGLFRKLKRKLCK